ncbi:hypothetical protein BT93_G0822 [Corymbia citriodora subsp. variegata]|nr:hypothetical protein BT93_G0822 [Corymbia citriodora subsp. variegata]
MGTKKKGSQLRVPTRLMTPDGGQAPWIGLRPSASLASEPGGSLGSRLRIRKNQDHLNGDLTWLQSGRSSVLVRKWGQRRLFQSRAAPAPFIFAWAGPFFLFPRPGSPFLPLSSQRRLQAPLQAKYEPASDPKKMNNKVRTSGAEQVAARYEGRGSAGHSRLAVAAAMRACWSSCP